MEWINAEEFTPMFPCIAYDANGNLNMPHGIITITRDEKTFSVNADIVKDPWKLNGKEADVLIWENRITHWMPVPNPPVSTVENSGIMKRRKKSGTD